MECIDHTVRTDYPEKKHFGCGRDWLEEYHCSCIKVDPFRTHSVSYQWWGQKQIKEAIPLSRECPGVVVVCPGSSVGELLCGLASIYSSVQAISDIKLIGLCLGAPHP